jgi:hypothetical protein
MSSVIIKFQSRVFLNHRRNTFLLVGEGDKYHHFLTMEDGVIDVKRMGKNSQTLKEMIPYNKYSLKHAADIYASTTLEKTAKARKILRAILANKDDSRTNFLPVSDQHNAEKPTRIERAQERANEITLEQICKDMSLDPKKVRAYFRDNDIKKPGQRWTWARTDKDKIVKLIKSLDVK